MCVAGESSGKAQQCRQTSSAGLSHWGDQGSVRGTLLCQVPVELLLLSVLALAASQLLVLHPLNTLVTLGIPFYHFLEESKS